MHNSGRWARLTALALLSGCGTQNELSAPRTDERAELRLASLLAGAVPLLSRTDSVLVIRYVARQLAVALADARVRYTLDSAFGQSTVREGKLHLQRYLRTNGTALGHAVDLGYGAPLGTWERAADLLPDLEVYIPVPGHRTGWSIDPDITVTGFLESDEVMRAGGGRLLGYDTSGNAIVLDYDTPPRRPVIVIYPVETNFGEDGQTPAFTSSAANTARFKIDPGPTPPPPCPGSGSGPSFYLCKSVITNVDQYEGWPRGAPEIAMTLESVETDAAGNALSKTRLGCINEDLLTASFYNQDADTWTGSAYIATKAALDNARASGRTVILNIWEDDQGTKCDFEPETNSRSNYGKLAGVGYLIFIASGGDPANWEPGLFIGAALWGIGKLLMAGSEDDWVGAAGLPQGTNPLTDPANIIQTPSDVRGALWFHVR